MNKFENLITDNFTVGHAESTLRSISDRIDLAMSKEKHATDLFKDLQRAHNAVHNALRGIEDVKEVINKYYQ